MKAKARRDRRPTIIDVAKAASVGVMTVSRVLNDNPTVRASTKNKVMNAIERVGYVQNDAARILKGRQARTISLIVPDLTDFFANCLHGIQEVATHHNYRTQVVATGRSSEIENEQLQAMISQHIAGLILVTSGGESRIIQNLIDSGISVVALDRPLPGLSVDAVLVDNREGAESGVRHLIEHGHRRIACVGLERSSFTTQERFEGYRRAMRDANLEPLLFKNVQSLEDTKALVASWRKNPDRPTAVFSVKRITSIQLIQALHYSKFRIPNELAIVGFDDFELAEVLGTPLTVISQSPTEIARSAAELLLRHIASTSEGESTGQLPVKMVFPTRLIIRASCGCPDSIE